MERVEEQEERVEAFEAEPTANGQPAEDHSPLSRLRHRREELRQERHVDLDIPGYGGELVVRFAPVAWEELRAIATRVDKSKSDRKELHGQADTLITACREVLIKVNGELGPIDPDSPNPVRFDGRLAALLGFEAEKAREVLFDTFNNDIAVTTVHNRYAEWLDGTDEEVAEEFVGES